MRRFFTASLIVIALAVSAAGVAPSAHAADVPQGACTEATLGQTCIYDDGSTGGVCWQPIGPGGKVICSSPTVPAGSASDAHAQETGGAPRTTQGGGTEVSGLGGAIDDATKLAAANTKAEESSFNIFRRLLNSVMWAITSLFAWLVGVAALMLNYAMLYTVVDMGAYVSKLSAIGTVWRILRDIGNILLIFGFLAIGISIIIDSEWYGGGQKLLPKLLIVAVFTNFSLFAAEAMIDVGNLFATQIYKQINGGNIPDPKGPIGDFKAVIEQKGVAGVLMTKLGLPAIYGSARDIKADGTNVFSSDTPWYMGFMSIILFIVAAFVMFALAFILISRFIVLILLIMVSPVGVAGLAVPGLQGWASKWWDTLFHQTITAPILLLMLYIALSVIVDPQFFGFGTTTPAWGGIATANFMGFAGTLLSYLIAMGLLLAVVYFAKTLSAVGAGWATKWGGRFSFGATAMGMSAVGGGAARFVRNRVQRLNPTTDRGRAWQRRVSRGARFVEDSRFDMRSIPGVGAGLTAANASEATKPLERSAVGRVRQVGEWWRKSGQESDRAYQQETVIPRLNAAVQEALRTGNYRPVSNILSSMSDKDFETNATQRALLNNPVAAALLSQSRFEKIQQSEAISQRRKDELAEARRNGDDPSHAQSRFNMTGPNGTAPFRFAPNHQFAGMTRGEALISTMNTATRGKLGGNVLTENTAPDGAPPVYVPRNAVLNRLDASDFEAIRRTGELAQGQKEAIGRYILSVINTPLPIGAPAAAIAHQNSLIVMRATPAFATYYHI